MSVLFAVYLLNIQPQLSLAHIQQMLVKYLTDGLWYY